MSTTQSRSPWLRLARGVLLALVAASMLAVLASLVLAPAHLSSHIEDYPPNANWSPESLQAALAELGWPVATVAWFDYVRTLWLYLGGLVPGLLVLRQRSYDWFGLYLGFAFAFVGAVSLLGPLVPLLPALEALIDWASAAAWQLFFIAFYAFPNGVFVPRWTRWLLPVWVGLNLVSYLYEGQAAEPVWVTRGYMVLVLLAVGSQVYRYLRRSDAVQRQQTKWVVFALAMLAVSIPVVFGSWSTLPAEGSLGATLVLHLAQVVIVNLLFGLVPVALAVAILRYRLWDIDVIIRRTLIYTVLTGLLVLAYFGSVLALESVFRALTGQGQNSLVVVLSTLAIAALFGPLRVRVQRAIDRRFFRQKYSAARTLAGFAASARDEVDLDRLSAELVDVVDGTLQPEHVGLWLRPTAASVNPAAAALRRYP